MGILAIYTIPLLFKFVAGAERLWQSKLNRMELESNGYPAGLEIASVSRAFVTEVFLFLIICDLAATLCLG